jgi:hypothetical protein
MANAGCIAYTVQDQDVFAVHMNERARGWCAVNSAWCALPRTQ